MKKKSLSVSQARFITLILSLIATRTRDGVVNERELIEWGLESPWLTHRERLSVPSRTDTRFANLTHDIVSHRNSESNAIRLGLLNWSECTTQFEITKRGWDFLEKVSVRLDTRKAVEGIKQCINFQVIDKWLRTQAAKDS